MVYQYTDWELRYFAPNSRNNKMVRFFNKNQPRTPINNSSYKKEFLERILSRDWDKLPIKHYSDMISPQEGWSNNGCFLQNEIIVNYEVILVLEEDKLYKTRNKTGRWLKIALRRADGNIILRSSHSREYDDTNNKSYINSQAGGWFIDNSTTSADYTFWKELKTKLGV